MARASRKREERLARKQGRALESEAPESEAPESSDLVEHPAEDLNGSDAEGEDLPKN